ncbi:MAG: hypothetical protein OW720_01840 [Buchnera aphidicola (Brevicoryne brassicae)]|uniref:Penicillin-binding protein activator LpoB n=1 Tax=Buchnera aphidicola (Brevicoryne brassicae) TaxID=911343 RepID=A0AAJ5TX62_9GAMM|nr:hypothetical protein [Buchnera aphidicola]QCI19918.1 hypothetical protein D9V66_01825 [Buchnera aphidicola (Brevicoryne brassicae)]WAI18741.1 MAG: hypothetical protein OW720_01840 [Buchnera aphidicola (Brevicoryne brassicae)]
MSIFFIVIFINSCSILKKIEKNSTKEKNSEFLFLDFDTAAENIILEILKSKNVFISNNTLFFVNFLKNNTNTIIDKKKLTNIIKNKISKNTNKVNFITNEIIDKDKKKLGLLNIKNLINTSTAILLSRNNHAKYYLESYISGNKEPFFLTLKLILVKTGEIIFLKTEKFYL